MLSYPRVCNRVVWLMAVSKTFCHPIAVLLTPFHCSPYLCFVCSLKLFLLLFSTTKHTLSLCSTQAHRVEDREFWDIYDCDSFTAIWNRGTGFLSVYKIPLVLSRTGNRNSFPVIQDTHSHSIPDIMPLGSGCGKLWGGGEQKFEPVGQHRSIEQEWMVSQWSGFDHDTIHEDLNLSRSECVCRRTLQLKWVALHENFARSLSALIPDSRGLLRYLVVGGLESGNQHHGWGHQEGLWETLVLLQIPGQVPTAASAKPVPQPHQAVCQQG